MSALKCETGNFKSAFQIYVIIDIPIIILMIILSHQDYFLLQSFEITTKDGMVRMDLGIYFTLNQTTLHYSQTMQFQQSIEFVKKTTGKSHL